MKTVKGCGIDGARVLDRRHVIIAIASQTSYNKGIFSDKTRLCAYLKHILPREIMSTKSQLDK